ncbi:hypothetical protein GGF31_001672 [Allomyces arbusculus]|nr:hypothetical protein GGF31_001672 [Allomyces arbusculus]
MDDQPSPSSSTFSMSVDSHSTPTPVPAASNATSKTTPAPPVPAVVAPGPPLILDRRKRTSQVKCDGGLPCRHCLEFQLDCSYVASSKRRARTEAATSPTSAPDEDTSTTAPTPPQDAPADTPAPLEGAAPAPASKRAARPRRRRRPAEQATSGTPTPPSSGSASPAPTCNAAPPPPPPPGTQLSPAYSLHPAPPGLGGTRLHAVRPSTAEDIEELNENMTLMVSLDPTGSGAHSFSQLGHSTGLHLLRGWSQAFNPNSVLYIQTHCQGRLNARQLAREQQLFPPRAFVTTMLDIYFNTMHPWIPILQRSTIERELGKPEPHYLLLYSVLATATSIFERMHNVTIMTQPRGTLLLSSYFAEKVLRMTHSTLVALVHQVESVQALLLMVLSFLHAPAVPWVLSGTALRIAQDLGLHLDLRAAPYQHVERCIPTWGKTWALAYAVDRMVSLLSGRPLMFHDGDYFLTTDVFTKTPDNLAKYPESVLVEPDSFFVQMVKLMDITGKIGRSVNSIQLRRQLPYTLPELHAMLSEYRRALPASRHFPPQGLDPGHREYQMNAFLSMLYLSAVVSLYRPLCTARSTVIESPLKDQYLALVDASATSMLEVLEAVGGEGKEVGLFPHLSYLSCMILGCLVLVVVNDPAAKPRALHSIDRLDAILAAASRPWPNSAIFQHIARDVKARMLDQPGATHELAAQIFQVMELTNVNAATVTDLLDESARDQQRVTHARAHEYMARHAAAVAVLGHEGATSPSELAALVQAAPPHPPPEWPLAELLASMSPVTPPQSEAAGVGTTDPSPPPLPVFPDLLATRDLAGILDWTLASPVAPGNNMDWAAQWVQGTGTEAGVWATLVSAAGAGNAANVWPNAPAAVPTAAVPWPATAPDGTPLWYAGVPPPPPPPSQLSSQPQPPRCP